MSGGKGGFEVVAFVPAIGAAVMVTLIACGAEVLAESREAIHYQKIINSERRKVDEAKKEQEEAYQSEVAKYKENLEKRINIKPKVISGISINAVDIKLYKDNVERPIELFKLIWEMCQPVVESGVPAGRRMDDILSKARTAVGQADNAALERLLTEAKELLPSAEKQISIMETRKEEFFKALARVKGLHEILGNVFIAPRFSYENADSLIKKLNDTAEILFREIEKIEMDPSLNMSESARIEAQRKVAERITSTLEQRGVALKNASVIESNKVMFYSYEGALLKITVSKTGMISMQIVGDMQYKDSQGYEREILKAMESFKADFPDFQKSLKSNGVGFELCQSAEPCKEIITYANPFNDNYYYDHPAGNTQTRTLN